MKIIWSRFAVKKLDEIYDYYYKEANEEIALRLVNGIIFHVRNIDQHPNAGQVEELLKDRKEVFRYLVHRNYKIIYFVENDFVKIVHIFDSRQNPVKMTKFK